ncbi:MAG: hypothetical protein NHB36_08840, partial [Nitrospira sp.]|nr:hypothetical protein [Nitrospira sp.]
GFTMPDGWGGTADFSLDSNAFRLQDSYAQDWANNFVFTIGVDDVEIWYQRARDLLKSNSFPDMRVKAPEPVDDSLVLHVWDPTGVL